tara:strand:+ start:84 stop:812 length:729 start_codon:yes stop_codon:yes gene_type:complete
VSLLEDDEGRMHLRNLSAQLARTEEEALNLLFLGDTNRVISETPMNLASSRSHCLFTIAIDRRKAGSDVVRRSKLHLVDLAGSERVKKTGIEGTSLKEAKYINLSLHFLEQVRAQGSGLGPGSGVRVGARVRSVITSSRRRAEADTLTPCAHVPTLPPTARMQVITSLGERQKSHVPYRNSMLTSVLRDSLGGNCKTVMVATMSPDEAQSDETISTCRFSQRVALISNRLELNEEVGPKLLI